MEYRTLQSFLAVEKEQGSDAPLISAQYLPCLVAWINVPVQSPLKLTTDSTVHAVVSPSRKSAHMLMTRSNLGAIECVRHSNHFDVCLLFPAIWELVVNC